MEDRQGLAELQVRNRSAGVRRCESAKVERGGGPSPGPSPRKLRAERGELSGRFNPCAESTKRTTARSMFTPSPTQFVGEGASLSERVRADPFRACGVRRAHRFAVTFALSHFRTFALSTLALSHFVPGPPA